jgi:hypothetical protein
MFSLGLNCYDGFRVVVVVVVDSDLYSKLKVKKERERR